MDKLPDHLLIQNYKLGCEKSLETLIKKHQTELFQFISYKVLDDDVANDVFQDTFFKIILTLKQDRYKEEGKFIVWAKRIAYNLIIDHFRLKKKEKKVSETSFVDSDFSIFDLLSSTEENIEEQLISQQIYEDLQKLTSQLPENQQEVLELRFYKGLSFKEIADETNCSINTTLGRVRYALINLRKIIEEQNIILTR